VKELAQKLARFHSLQVPLSKKNHLHQSIVDLHARAYKKYPIDQLIAEMKLETLANNDLISEFEFIKKLMIKTDSPVVFVHNDFRNRNLLVKDEGGIEGDMIVVCDFEYANYTYRAYDFGTLFSKAWGGMALKRKPLVADEVMRPFFEEYIDEMIRIHGREKYLSDKRNTVERMLLEVKVFHLIPIMFACVFFLQADEEKQMEMFTRTSKMVSVRC